MERLWLLRREGNDNEWQDNFFLIPGCMEGSWKCHLTFLVLLKGCLIIYLYLSSLEVGED